MKRTREEWRIERAAMHAQPRLDTPEHLARALEMTERERAITRYLDGEGPEPEWPWNPEHPATPEEREEELRRFLDFMANGHLRG